MEKFSQLAKFLHYFWPVIILFFSVGVTVSAWTVRTPLFEGKKPENQKNIISIRKGRLLLINDQDFSQIAPT